jgi:hypothetical protein
VSDPSSPVTPATFPGRATNVVAAAGGGSASVSWLAPSSDGGAQILSYTVTAFPGGLTRTVSGGTTASFSSLANGTTYTFTVAATNRVGTGQASDPSGPVAPQADAPPPSTATGTASSSSSTTVSTAPTPPPGGTATSVTVPAGTPGGTDSIAAGTASGPPPGYSVLGQQITISAPTATPRIR